MHVDIFCDIIIIERRVSMKITLSSQFYNKKRELTCPKCKHKVLFTFSQLGKIIVCPFCKVKIKIEDGITPALKKL